MSASYSIGVITTLGRLIFIPVTKKSRFTCVYDTQVLITQFRFTEHV